MYFLQVRGEQRPPVVSAVRYTARIVGNTSSAYLLFAIWLSSHLIACGEARATSSSELHDARPTLTIPQGKLQGFTMLSSKNRTIYAFTGVPYAQPPIGDLRFFHKYITHSGVAVFPALQRPKESCAEDAILLGEYLGCPTDTFELLVDCLRGLDGSQLVDTESVFRAWKSWPLYSWGPTVEPDIEGGLITEVPAALVAEGKGQNLPWITSTVRDESLATFADFIRNASFFEELLQDIDDSLSVILGYVRTSSNVTAFTEGLKSYYLPDLTAERTLLMYNLEFLEFLDKLMAAVPWRGMTVGS